MLNFFFNSIVCIFAIWYAYTHWNTTDLNEAWHCGSSFIVAVWCGLDAIGSLLKGSLWVLETMAEVQR